MAEIIRFPRPHKPHPVDDPTPSDELYDGDEFCWIGSNYDDPECDCPECISYRNDLEPIAPAQSETPKEPKS
jgi:hypothetical protein